MEKNFTELHVGGVYEAEDGEIVFIIGFDREEYYPFLSARANNKYLNDGRFLIDEESHYDLVKYLGEYSDIVRLPKIMAENERLKAELEQLGRDAK